MKALILAVIMMCAGLVMAQSEFIDAIEWVDQTDSNNVYIANYWWDQFPNRKDADGDYLYVIAKTNIWLDLSVDQQTYVIGTIAGLLNGSVEASVTNLQAVQTLFDAQGISARLVEPGQPAPPITNICVGIAGKGVSIVNRLMGFGVMPPPEVD